MTTTWDILGNASVVDRLAADARSGRPHHAYLLTGPAHVGKGTVAARFARALLCGRPEAPCGTCPNCALMSAGNHPDLLEASGVDAISIDQVRELRRALALSPHSAPFRVAVITDAERLSVPGQNALLKLLEEPPERAVLILTAAAPAQLLPTTVSRCRQLRLQVPAASDLTALDHRALRAADRRPGLAKTLAEDPEELALREAWAGRFPRLRSAAIPERLTAAKELAADDRLADVLDSWIGLVRHALGPPEKTEPKIVTELRNQVGHEALAKDLSRLFAARKRLGYNPNVQLLVEQLLLRLND